MTQQTAIVPHYAAVQMSTFGQGALPALQSLADVVSIAQLMAKSGVAVRKHLRENPGACFAVTMQALRWNADPFAVANKSYAVNDQIAYEAQLIAAVINTMAPIKRRPHYTYEGEGADRVCIATVEMLDGDILEKRSPKFKDIQPKNSPLWKSDPDQQQAYYTIRAWARLHTPEVILGIYDPEEAASMEPARIQPEKTDLVGKLSQAVGGEGFEPARVEVELGDSSDKPRRGRPRKEPEAHQAFEPERQLEPETSTEDTDVNNERPTMPEAATGMEPVQDAEIEPATSASVTLASTDSAAVTSSPASLSIQSSAGEAVADGHAQPGETYLMAGEPFVDGRRLTYRDGERFSSVGEPGASGLKVYAVHAPLTPEPEPEPDIPDHMQLDSLDQAESEARAPETHPPEFIAYTDAVEGAESFQAVKTALLAFQKTAVWPALSEAQANTLRRRTWEAVSERAWRPDPLADISAFRLWIEAQDDPEAVDQGLCELESRDDFKSKPAAAKENVRGAVAARLRRLEDELAQ